MRTHKFHKSYEFDGLEMSVIIIHIHSVLCKQQSQASDYLRTKRDEHSTITTMMREKCKVQCAETNRSILIHILIIIIYSPDKILYYFPKKKNDAKIQQMGGMKRKLFHTYE